MKYTRNVKPEYQNPRTWDDEMREIRNRVALLERELPTVYAQLRAAHEAGKAKAFLHDLPVADLYACAVQAAEYKSISVDRALTLIYLLKNR